MKILKFYTPTCMPCKIIGKMLNKLEDIEIVEVDASEDVVMVDKYNVCMTPTLIFLKEDKEVERTHGMIQESKLKEIINKYK